MAGVPLVLLADIQQHGTTGQLIGGVGG